MPVVGLLQRRGRSPQRRARAALLIEHMQHLALTPPSVCGNVWEAVFRPRALDACNATRQRVQNGQLLHTVWPIHERDAAPPRFLVPRCCCAGNALVAPDKFPGLMKPASAENCVMPHASLRILCRHMHPNRVGKKVSLRPAYTRNSLAGAGQNRTAFVRINVLRILKDAPPLLE